METNQERRSQAIAKGQLWKIEHGYVYITDLGQRLIHYKLLSEPEQNAAITRMIGIGPLVNFLKHNEAQLVGSRAVLA